MTIQGVAEQELASSIHKACVGVDRYGMAKKCQCQNSVMNPSNPLRMTKLCLQMGLKTNLSEVVSFK
jgi:hypothetical protein